MTTEKTRGTYRIPIRLLPQEEPSEYCESYPKGRIIYPNLVFTLRQDPTKYLRPTLKITDGKIEVVKNWTFLSAARDAGLASIACDVIADSNENINEPEVNEFCPARTFSRYIFFKGDTKLPFYSPDAFLTCFWKNKCLHYDASPETEDPQQLSADFKSFLNRIVRLNSKNPIRSIDGITFLPDTSI